MNKAPAQKINGLIDGMAVLQELAMSPLPCSGKAIAEKLSLNPVRVNRILKTLAYTGFAHRDRSRKYSVGPGMHVLAVQSVAASGLLNRAVPQLKKLSLLGFTVALGVLWKDKVCYLYHNSADSEFNSGLGRMLIYDAEKSSIGQVLLSALADEYIQKSLGRKPDKALLSALESTREKGFAAVRHPDHVSLAVAVGNPPYAGIALSGIEEGEEDKYAKILKDAASEI